MTSLSRITCHAVHRMAPEAREALARELYNVHCQIFTGLEFEDFRAYVVERDAWRTWIYVRHNASGQLVGYTAIHAFRLRVRRRPCTIIRMEAGTLPAARGRDLTMVHGLLRLLRIWAQEPWRRVRMFAALTHPSSYTFLAHYVPTIWPHAERAIPPKVMQEMEELAAIFHLERVDDSNPLLRHVNWVTMETEEDRQRWRSSTRRDTRFYIEANPGYALGHGLLTYLPIGGIMVMRSLARFLRARAGKLSRMVFGDMAWFADRSQTVRNK